MIRRSRSHSLFVVVGFLAGCGPAAAPQPDPGDDTDEPWPTVPQAPQPEVMVDGLSSPCGLAVIDDAMYVAEKGTGSLLRFGLAAPSSATEVASGLAAPTFLASSGSDLVVVDEGASAILRVRAGVVTPLAANQVRPTRVRIADGFVYWIAQGDQMNSGAIRRVSIEGGTVTELVGGLGAPNGLSVTSTRIYFTETTSKTVGYVPLAGGTPTRWTDPLASTPFDVRSDEAAGQVFWTSIGRQRGGLVRRADLDLMNQGIVAYSPPGPAWLVFSGQDLLWNSQHAISRSSRAAAQGDYDDVVAYASSCDLEVTAGALYFTDPVTGRVLRQALP